MRSTHLTRAGVVAPAAAALLLLWSTSAPLQAQAPPTSTFTVFLRGTPIGSEQVSVERTASRFTIRSSGRIAPPVDLVLRSFQLDYDAEWNPIELQLDTTIRGESRVLRSRVTGTQAASETTLLDQPTARLTETIAARALLVPNPVVAPYEAVAARLKDSTPGTMLSMHQPTNGSFPVEVGVSSSEQIKTLDRTISARRTRLIFRLPNAPELNVEVWGDESGRLLRVSIPAQSLEFAREDIASVSARIVTMSRSNDEDVQIPANGFSLGGTISKPPASSGTMPAVVLVSGSDPADRDDTVAGVAILGQISNTLAEAGFLVIRYDTRGVGQSGGRPEGATISNYAEDARAAVDFLWNRKDVDRKRIGIVGHGEGGWLALMTAAGTNRVAAVGVLATAGASGTELNLYQLSRSLERSSQPEAERQKTIDLQKAVQQAVITGKGWDQLSVSPQVRRQADTPYLQSFLRFDPAKVVKNVKQPMLIVHAERDRQIPAASADQLDTMAKARKRSTSEVLKVPAINHLLVGATTGEVDEYERLPARTIDPAIGARLVDWLRRALLIAR